MANNAAKNINSLESQTIVPTATIFGRLVRPATCAWVVMGAIIPDFALKIDISNVLRWSLPVKLITRFLCGKVGW
jgi:hypothetical protein